MDTRYLVTKYWLIKQFCDNLQSGGGKSKRKWKTLVHNGVAFPPEYIQHNIPISYKGTNVKLTKEEEEPATLYAKYLETDYVKNKTFNKNFWHDWKKILGSTHTIQNLEDCDFKKIYDYLLDEKEKKKLITAEEKEKDKEAEKKYKIAIVDDIEQPVGNFKMEPPGIFIGRGCNPKLGKLKKRIYPEDITINISKDTPIKVPMEGHKWGDIIHDSNVEWLASWKDDITGKMKYVWLGAHSDMKGKNDMEKFDLARKLKRNIGRIREENDQNMKSKDLQIKQIATALYFIEHLALRVGNEKGSDEADTVGVTSLRVEHIKLLGSNKITLDFLGKDSVRYHNTIVADAVVYANLEEFMKDKSKDDNLFDKITPDDVNKYLQNFMKGLTSKVFRTYNASNLFQRELRKITAKYDNYDKDDKINMLLDDFNKANAKVALLCNHQKNISKGFGDRFEKINEQIKKLKSKLKKAQKSNNQDKMHLIRNKIKQYKSKKELIVQLKNISLGTSKMNYIDPRITVAFMKTHDLPVDRIFSKSLQEKFKWAMEIETDFKF